MVDAAREAIDVVVSYAREDAERAKLLVEALQAEGLEVWWDQNIDAGRKLADDIERALEEAAAVMVLWSPDATKSDWVLKEAGFALDREKLVPVFIKKTPLPLRFSDLLTPDLSKWPKAGTKEFEKLVAQIRKMIARRDATAREARAEPEVIPEAGRKPKLVLIYAGKDYEVVHGKSKLRAFLEAVAKDEDLAFWWDERKRPKWDDKTKVQLQEATIVICLLSEAFFNPSYGRANSTWNQLIRQGTPILPILYRKCDWEKADWLKKLLLFPADGKPVEDRTDQFELFFELAIRIKRLLGRREDILDGSALWTMRQRGQAQFVDSELARLRRDACRRAEHWVPDPRVRQEIVRKAKPKIRDNKMRPLSKLDLALLDEDILITDHEREPDPKRIRWVLRCADLHPQGRYTSATRISF